MTDARPAADDAQLQLDRLGAVILDDIGDGPSASDFMGSAVAARDAVRQVGIAAFNEVTDLVVGAGLRFMDHGDHDLKGVPGSWHLFALQD